MTEETDYENIPIPDGKDPADYKWTERRAEILQIIKRVGGPWEVKQVDLARRYGVSESQISQDMDRLRSYLSEQIGRDAKMLSRVLLEKAVSHRLDDDDPESAFGLVMQWNTWLQSIGEQEQAPARHEVEQTLIDGMATDSYEIIEDDATVEGDVVDVAAVRSTPMPDHADGDAEDADADADTDADADGGGGS